jgi:hypothetical protein
MSKIVSIKNNKSINVQVKQGNEQVNIYLGQIKV